MDKTALDLETEKLQENGYDFIFIDENGIIGTIDITQERINEMVTNSIIKGKDTRKNFYYIDDNNASGPQSNQTKLKKSLIAIEKGFGKWNKGKNRSDEAKKKVSDSKKGNTYKKNKKCSEETKRKMSISRIGRNITWGDKISKSNMKPIIQYDLDGNIIREYPSITYASKEMNLSISVISSCIRKKRKTRGNYFFKFKE